MSRKIIRVFLSFLLLIYVSSLSSETVIEYISNGERLYKEKKYREALNHFKEALEENPSSVKANLGLAKTSLALGSLGDAFNSYKVVLETDPSHKEAITGFSEVLSLQGKNKEALNIIEKALKDEPYNKMLLLQKPKILLRMGRSKSALKFLKEIKTLIDVGYDYNVLLAKSYIANSNFSKASEIVGKLNNKYPEEPEIFYEKARIDLELASRESDPEKIEEYMIEARDLLVTSISLDPEYLDSKRLLVKNYLWLGEYEDAKRVCEEILEAIPSDTEMIYYSAYLNSRLNKNQPAAINFGKLLNLNEIDSFARVSAESFSIANLNEKHPLRTNLGRYRLDQFEKDSHEFYYRNAEFHINRALDLFPENSHLKKKLADFYYRRGDKKRLIKILLKLREDDPDDIRINNRLEAILKKLRTSLTYREGYLEKDASLLNGIRTEPQIFIFDLKPEGFIPDFPDSSKIVTESLKYAISLRPDIKLVSQEEEKGIRASISENYGKAKFTDSIYYSPESVQKLNNFRKKDSLIRFIGYGSFKTGNRSISVDFNIYDRETGKIIKNFKMSSFGRNQISEVSVRLAHAISKTIPKEGKVLKIKKESMIINIGFRDGLKKGDTVAIGSEEKVYTVAEIINLDEFISEVVVKEKNTSWKKNIGEGYKVKKVKIVKVKKVKVNAEEAEE